VTIGLADDYVTLLDVSAPLLRSRVPLHLTLGNHDDRANARAALGPFLGPPDPEVDRCVSEVQGPGVRFLLLDSMISPNTTPGRLGPEQVAWLAHRLDADAATPAIVFVHHNLNATWESALRDTDALLHVLRTRAQAKMVVFGHTHVWNVRLVDGLHMVNLPAVGYRFHPKQPLGWCQFRPLADGCELQLRTIGGDQRKDGWTARLAWRSG
jgi:3',5'-cyclic AMP phosphodiesterase CpdA